MPTPDDEMDGCGSGRGLAEDDVGAGEDDYLDGCSEDFGATATITGDADIDALVMFAGVQWDDPAAVEAQRRALVEWSAG